jgi:hypothetical protein
MQTPQTPQTPQSPAQTSPQISPALPTGEKKVKTKVKREQEKESLFKGMQQKKYGVKVKKPPVKKIPSDVSNTETKKEETTSNVPSSPKSDYTSIEKEQEPKEEPKVEPLLITLDIEVEVKPEPKEIKPEVKETIVEIKEIKANDETKLDMLAFEERPTGSPIDDFLLSGNDIVQEDSLEFLDDADDLPVQSSLLSSFIGGNSTTVNQEDEIITYAKDRLAELSVFPKSDTDTEKGVQVYKVYEDFRTVIVLSFEKNDAKTNVEMVPPKSIRAFFETGSNGGSATVEETKAAFSTSTEQTLFVAVSLAEGLTGVVSENLMFKVTFTSNNQPTTFVRIVRTTVLDLLRPTTEVTTSNDFGQLWGLLKAERRIRINNKTIRDGQGFSDAAFRFFNHVKAISSIKNESIIAMRVVGLEGIVLVHAVVNWNANAAEQSKIIFSVRSKDLSTTELVCKWANACSW